MEKYQSQCCGRERRGRGGLAEEEKGRQKEKDKEDKERGRKSSKSKPVRGVKKSGDTRYE